MPGLYLRFLMHLPDAQIPNFSSIPVPFPPLHRFGSPRAPRPAPSARYTNIPAAQCIPFSRWTALTPCMPPLCKHSMRCTDNPSDFEPFRFTLFHYDQFSGTEKVTAS
ncbi:hypothetical protein B0H11DRAFT_2230057 [Mycena galericulata]|nr:hypothetical protein B0H11DRAFT_2230057 [Mycena galericulata]